MDNQKETCFNCKEELPNVSPIYFCPNCAYQLQCKNCDAMILPNAKVCVNCGNLVKQNSISNTGEVVMNEIDFEQKGNYKRFKSKFTNEVGAPLAETFATFIGGNTQLRRLQNPFANTAAKPQNNKQIGNRMPTPKPAEEAIVLNDTDYSELLQRYFTIEENRLKLINSRLKHRGKLDQAIRLALLCLYAFEKAGQTQVEKSVLAEIVTSIGRYDAHFQGWLSKCDEILKEENKLSLSVPGKETAEEILKELADESISKGSVEFSKSSRRGSGRKGKKGDTGDEQGTNTDNSKSRSSKGAMYYFDILIKEGFFTKKRKVSEIIEHLKVNKAENYKYNELSTPLMRAIKNGKLKREKSSDNQYEYFA